MCIHLVQDLIGGDGLDLIKLYLAPVRTFWKGVPEGSQVSSVGLSTNVEEPEPRAEEQKLNCFL